MKLIELLEKEIARIEKILERDKKKLSADEKVRLMSIIAHDKGRIACEKKI